MTRAFLTMAGALLATGTLLSTAAEACISCEYVPEVVRAHTTDRSGSASSFSYRSHGYVADQDRSSRRSSKRIAKSEEPKKQQKIAKAAKAEKKEPKLAKVEKNEPKLAKASKPEREAVKVARVEPEPKKALVVAKKAVNEASSITVAAVVKTAASIVDDAGETAAKPTDCKKFFASVGMTLTVPCE